MPKKLLEQKNLKELMKTLDRIFSEYIRLKASVGEFCQCITCGKFYHWKDIHNGHFISRGNPATRYSEINCNPQCCSCNSFKQGEWLKYENRLIEIHGMEAVEKLKQDARLGGQFTRYGLRDLILKYQEKLKILKIEKL